MILSFNAEKGRMFSICLLSVEGGVWIEAPALFVFRDFYKKPPWCIIPDMEGGCVPAFFLAEEDLDKWQTSPRKDDM